VSTVFGGRAASTRKGSSSPGGAQVALGQLARIDVTRGATLIKSENAYLNNIVYVDVLGRDIGGYVADAKKLLEEKLSLPPGYRLEWSGSSRRCSAPGADSASRCL
jgi:Cu(I)/Ag(I) efflux system membrane protein CusA/SilA